MPVQLFWRIFFMSTSSGAQDWRAPPRRMQPCFLRAQPFIISIIKISIDILIHSFHWPAAYRTVPVGTAEQTRVFVTAGYVAHYPRILLF